MKKPSDFKTESELWDYCNENNLVIVNGEFIDRDDCYLGGE